MFVHKHQMNAERVQRDMFLQITPTPAACVMKPFQTAKFVHKLVPTVLSADSAMDLMIRICAQNVRSIAHYAQFPTNVMFVMMVIIQMMASVCYVLIISLDVLVVLIRPSVKNVLMDMSYHPPGNHASYQVHLAKVTRAVTYTRLTILNRAVILCDRP